MTDDDEFYEQLLARDKSQEETDTPPIIVHNHVDYMRRDRAAMIFDKNRRKRDQQQAKIEQLERDIASIEETEVDFPLYRRISNQRRELKALLFWNNFWETRDRKSRAELKELRDK